MSKFRPAVWASAAALGIGVLAWSSSQAQDPAPYQAPQPRIATADVLGVVERMLASERYASAQKAYLDQENDKLKPLADELANLEKRASSLPKESPDLDQIGRDYDQKRQAFDQARQEAFGRIDSYNTDQVREAYRLTLQAVDDLSTKLGYTHVLSSRTGAATIRSNNVPGALQEILARPVAKADPADDLTDRLIQQFKLESVKVDDPPVPVKGNNNGRTPLPPGGR